jgi:prepilin-type N-terminal cleavage/methylation domain-containing protein
VRRDSGFTLLELVVVVSLVSVVSFGALQFLDSTTSVVARSTSDVQAENDARFALRTMTEDIRGGLPSTMTYTVSSSVCPATPTSGNCISFTVLRNTQANPSCQSLITYGLVSGAVKESRTDTGCATQFTVSARPIISNVVNGSTAMFQYYDISGNNVSSARPPLPQQNAVSIRVTLIVQYKAGTPSLTFSSEAALRNARA